MKQIVLKIYSKIKNEEFNMSKKNSKHKSDKRTPKKATVLEAGKKENMKSMITVIGIAVVVTGLLFFLYKDNNNASDQKYQPKMQNSRYIFDARVFDDGVARHFQHRTGDIVINYFVLKSSDGIIRAAYDACDVCWREGKGYYQDGDDMVCRNCGRKFPSVLVNEVKGGCNPAPLKRQVTNGKVVISIKDILQGRQYFDFSKRS
jgi:uncharacterized membrane protein